MNNAKIYIVAALALSVTACNVLKRHPKPKGPAPVVTTVSKPTEPAVAPAQPATPIVPGTPMWPAPVPKSRNGIYAPGIEELTAIQVRHKEVTMQTLNDGYAIYTGACTNCHGAKSIYFYPEDKWPGIIEDMAPGAKITNAQKDAVLKYVLSIKATQPK